MTILCTQNLNTLFFKENVMFVFEKQVKYIKLSRH